MESEIQIDLEVCVEFEWSKQNGRDILDRRNERGIYILIHGTIIRPLDDMVSHINCEFRDTHLAQFLVNYFGSLLSFSKISILVLQFCHSFLILFIVTSIFFLRKIHEIILGEIQLPEEGRKGKVASYQSRLNIVNIYMAQFIRVEL